MPPADQIREQNEQDPGQVAHARQEVGSNDFRAAGPTWRILQLRETQRRRHHQRLFYKTVIQRRLLTISLRVLCNCHVSLHRFSVCHDVRLRSVCIYLHIELN